jgi:hypothetical protein
MNVRRMYWYPADPPPGGGLGAMRWLVSDFVFPAYFQSAGTDPSRQRYDFVRGVVEPLQLLHGGYIAWLCKGTSAWFQARSFEGDKPQIVLPGKAQ